MSLNFILSVIFPTRNLILKPLENTKKGKGCLYVKKLADVDLKVLEEIIKTSITLTVKKINNELPRSFQHLLNQELTIFLD